MNKRADILRLRQTLARAGLPPDRPPRPLGVAAADAALGGGLLPGTLHEVFAADWSAGGFAACLAILMTGDKPLFWVRPDYEAAEYGGLHAAGLLELGGRPDRLFLVRAADAAGALSAGADILSCPHVGALVLELSGHPAALDAVAGRRLAFLAAQNGVTALLLRAGAAALPSPAQTRWHAAAAPTHGQDLGGDDWGRPAFRAELLRNRAGPTGQWTFAWSPDDGCFHPAAQDRHAPHPGRVAAAASHRPADARHAG